MTIRWRRLIPPAIPAANALVGLNLLYTLVAMAVFGAHNLFAPTQEMLFRMGALVPAAVYQGEYWRVVTYGFLHIGAWHLAFNMIALSQVGPALESEIGTPRLLSVYLLALLAGAGLELAVRGPAVIIIAGASGALYGLLGFGISFGHFYGGEAGRAQRNFFLQWTAYAFLFGLLFGAAHVCHFGGLLLGLVAGFLIEHERANHDRLTPFWRVLAFLLSAISAGAFLWMLVRQL